MKKIFLALLMLINPLFVISGDQYPIIRISEETLQKTVEKETYDANMRSVKKWAMVGAAAVTVIGLLKLQSHFAFTGELIKKDDIKVDQALTVSVLEGIMRDMKNVSSWVVTGVTAFLGGQALNFGANQYQGNFTALSESQELSGFIKHETKLSQFLHIMKEFAVPFDIYSDKLSVSLNFADQRMMIEDFMKDMMHAVEGSNELAQRRLLATMKKDYVQKSAVLTELQEFALHAMNYRQRIETDLVTTPLEIEQFNRATIAEISNHLILDVERIAAFIEYKSQDSYMKNYFEQGNKTLIQTTNIFAEQIQKRLALPIAELLELSKRGDGLFDLICNYSLFVEQYIEVANMRLQY